MSPYVEINLKRAIEAGEVPGPRMHITGPRLSEGLYNYSPASAEDARRMVRYWAEEGATWIKAHGRISSANLGAAIDEAHRQGIKLTGHLCSVTYGEAIELGIDNLEHGLFVASDFHPDKKPDLCPPTQRQSLAQVDIRGEQVQSLIRRLVDSGVAVTSTLAVIEQMVPGRPVEDRVLDLDGSGGSRGLPGGATRRFKTRRPSRSCRRSGRGFSPSRKLRRRRRAAGGRCRSHRERGRPSRARGPAELRAVDRSGLHPLQAIQVMSANGARILGEYDRLGSISEGKLADMVVIRGDPITKPSDIRNVIIVFKDGVGYDSPKLLDSLRGVVGAR